MTHPDWLELVTACCRQPELQRVLVQTNATLIDAETIKLLGGDRFPKLSFQVSLDGCTESTHDLVRGPGSLKKAMHGLRCLIDAGFGAQTAIAFTEMRHNFHEIPQLLEIADQLGVAAVIGLPLVQIGGAAQNPLTLLPAKEQYLALLERFASDDGLRRRYQRLGKFSAIEWMKGISASVHPGCRFLERPYVTVSGLLFPCALLQVDTFAGRGTYERSLVDAIVTGLPVWADLQQVSQARTTDLACIASCAGGRHCGGGCLARAYLPDRDLSAREDRCALRQAVYSWSANRKNHIEW
jgi:MoaA/NifB/PqqE/SkfB family radical SAM enzyme